MLYEKMYLIRIQLIFHDKTEFGEKLSESNDENSAVYTIKLNDTAMNIIREFKP